MTAVKCKLIAEWAMCFEMTFEGEKDLSFTCKIHHACLSFVSVHQMAPPLNMVANIIAAHYSFIDPERMKD